jgi:FixJ family two-component response regulator
MVEPAKKNRPLISIVDDDASLRTATARFVRSFGFAACAFGSAEEFLESIERRETSCIVSDVQMPGTNGIELQSRLVAENDRTPIIFITAYPQPDTEKRALEAGAICFLSKPFDGQTLVNCIRRALTGERGEHDHV